MRVTTATPQWRQSRFILGRTMERPKAPREPRRRKATDHQGRGVWGGCVFPMCVFFTYKSVHLGLTPAFSFFWGGEKWRTIGQSDSRQNRKYLYRDQSPSRRDRHLWQRVIYRDRCAACTPCSLCGPYSSISVLYSDVDMTSVLFRYYSRDHVMLWHWADMMMSRLPDDG